MKSLNLLIWLILMILLSTCTKNIGGGVGNGAITDASWALNIVPVNTEAISYNSGCTNFMNKNVLYNGEVVPLDKLNILSENLVFICQVSSRYSQIIFGDTFVDGKLQCSSELKGVLGNLLCSNSFFEGVSKINYDISPFQKDIYMGASFENYDFSDPGFIGNNIWSIDNLLNPLQMRFWSGNMDKIMNLMLEGKFKDFFRMGQLKLDYKNEVLGSIVEKIHNRSFPLDPFDCILSKDFTSCIMLNENFLRYIDQDNVGYFKSTSTFPVTDFVDGKTQGALQGKFIQIVSNSKQMYDFQVIMRTVFEKLAPTSYRGVEFALRGDLEKEIIRVRYKQYSDYFETEKNDNTIELEENYPYFKNISSAGICLDLKTLERVEDDRCNGLDFFNSNLGVDDCISFGGEENCSPDRLKPILNSENLFKSLPGI
jgi:hypothetical protein